jgi:hypothetical protein
MLAAITHTLCVRTAAYMQNNIFLHFDKFQNEILFFFAFQNFDTLQCNLCNLSFSDMSHITILTEQFSHLKHYLWTTTLVTTGKSVDPLYIFQDKFSWAFYFTPCRRPQAMLHVAKLLCKNCGTYGNFPTFQPQIFWLNCIAFEKKANILN